MREFVYGSFQKIAKLCREDPSTVYCDKASSQLWQELKCRARNEAADYVAEHMSSAIFRRNRRSVLHFVLSQRVPGIIAEFGVFTGSSINFIAKHVPADQVVHGFDSFEGLPEKAGNYELWKGYKVGRFGLQGRLPRVQPNVRLHSGWFSDTVPPFFSECTEPVSLLHIDSDVYESARIVLESAAESIQPGSILVFDEFFNYPGYRFHEFKAFHEAAEAHSWSYRFLAFSGYSAAVLIEP